MVGVIVLKIVRQAIKPLALLRKSKKVIKKLLVGLLLLLETRIIVVDDKTYTSEEMKSAFVSGFLNGRHHSGMNSDDCIELATGYFFMHIEELEFDKKKSL